jgi:Cu(I)/Ag(I) efflux system periplasmic protein CusF
MSHVSNWCRHFVAFAMLTGMLTTLLSFSEVRAQGVQQMPGMGEAKQGTKTVSTTGTVSAVNTADRRIRLTNGPIPELTWPAMTMEFPILSSVDLSKVKVGDKVRFTISGGSGNVYTVQSISPEQ